VLTVGGGAGAHPRQQTGGWPGPVTTAGLGGEEDKHAISYTQCPCNKPGSAVARRNTVDGSRAAVARKPAVPYVGTKSGGFGKRADASLSLETSIASTPRAAAQGRLSGIGVVRRHIESPALLTVVHRPP